MLSNITFGRFFPGSSPIHKVDPRVKISLMIALLVLVFLSRNYLAIFINFAAIFTLMTLTKIPLRLPMEQPGGIFWGYTGMAAVVERVCRPV